MSCVPVNASSKSLKAFSALIALSGVLLIQPFGGGTCDAVLSFNGHLKVMGQGARSTTCLRKG